MRKPGEANNRRVGWAPFLGGDGPFCKRGLQQSGTEFSDPALSSYLSLVIDTLKEVDETRKCYRMVGGVLVERTVKEVLPALENNKEQVSKNPCVDALGNQGVRKGRPGL